MALPDPVGGYVQTLPPTTLDAGVPKVLVNAVASAVLTSSYYFAVPLRGDGGDHTLNLEAVGAGAVPTTFTANLEILAGDGVTWQPYGASGTGIALVATSVGTAFQVKNVVAGVYRINPTTVVLGSASSVSVVGTLS